MVIFCKLTHTRFICASFVAFVCPICNICIKFVAFACIRRFASHLLALPLFSLYYANVTKFKF